MWEGSVVCFNPVGLESAARLVVEKASSHLICSCKCNMQHLMGAYHIPILKKHMKNTHKSLEQGYHGGRGIKKKIKSDQKKNKIGSKKQ